MTQKQMITDIYSTFSKLDSSNNLVDNELGHLEYKITINDCNVTLTKNRGHNAGLDILVSDMDKKEVVRIHTFSGISGFDFLEYLSVQLNNESLPQADQNKILDKIDLNSILQKVAVDCETPNVTNNREAISMRIGMIKDYYDKKAMEPSKQYLDYMK